MLKRLFSLFPTKPVATKFILPITPDQPIAFGLKNQWLAIQTHLPETVFNQLPVNRIQVANWETGLSALYADSHNSKPQAIFVSPSINGWVFCDANT